MENGITLSFTAEQIDVRLENAGNAILHTEQTLTEEQKAQARANIGGDVYKQKMLCLNDYGIDIAGLILAGGGIASIEGDFSQFWKEANTDRPLVLVTKDFYGMFDIYPPPATKAYNKAGEVVMLCLALVMRQTDQVMVSAHVSVMSTEEGITIFAAVEQLPIPETTV